MILAIFLTAVGFVFSIHFATVKTVFGLFWRDGYVPPPDLLAAAERVERRWENPAFFAAVSLGRTLGTFLLTLGLWLWTAASVPSTPLFFAGRMLLVLVVVYTFGQFLPRMFARPFAERLLPISLFLQTVFEPFLSPVAQPLSALQNRIQKGMKWDGRLEFLNEEERQKIEQKTTGESEGQLEEVEREMIRAVLDFGDTMVREIMTPRLQVVAIPVDATREAVLEVSRDSRYSRIPVYSENLDHVVGILHVSDLLYVDANEDFDLARHIRPTQFVPETKRINDLMHEFRERALHMVVVVDEHGSVAGLATLEDVLEEIVGEIRDETDEERPLLRQREDGTWEVDGSLRLDAFDEEIGKEFGSLHVPDDADVETVAGAFLLAFGEVPEVGARATCGIWDMEVAAMDGNRIAQMVIRRRESGDPSSSGPTDEG